MEVGLASEVSPETLRPSNAERLRLTMLSGASQADQSAYCSPSAKATKLLTRQNDMGMFEARP